jgi:hypothetical protein
VKLSEMSNIAKFDAIALEGPISCIAGQVVRSHLTSPVSPIIKHVNYL